MPDDIFDQMRRVIQAQPSYGQDGFPGDAPRPSRLEAERNHMRHINDIRRLQLAATAKRDPHDPSLELRLHELAADDTKLMGSEFFDLDPAAAPASQSAHGSHRQLHSSYPQSDRLDPGLGLGGNGLASGSADPGLDMQMEMMEPDEEYLTQTFGPSSYEAVDTQAFMAPPPLSDPGLAGRAQLSGAQLSGAQSSDGASRSAPPGGPAGSFGNFSGSNRILDSSGSSILSSGSGLPTHDRPMDTSSAGMGSSRARMGSGSSMGSSHAATGSSGGLDPSSAGMGPSSAGMGSSGAGMGPSGAGMGPSRSSGPAASSSNSSMGSPSTVIGSSSKDIGLPGALDTDMRTAVGDLSLSSRSSSFSAPISSFAAQSGVSTARSPEINIAEALMDDQRPENALLKVELPSKDRRKFKTLMMPNGMEVMIVNEPLNKGTVALSVAAGSKDDPPEVPGLAQFVQRMVTCGSKRFPGVRSHREYFVSKHDSSAGAVTTHDLTVHTTQVVNQFMRASIERLMRSVTEPLFPPEAVAEELDAMDEIFLRKASDATVQYHQLEKILVGNGYNVPQYGNRSTLLSQRSKTSTPSGELASLQSPGLDPEESAVVSDAEDSESQPSSIQQLKNTLESRDMLLDYAWQFFRKYYVPSRMKLLIYASQKIELVEKWITYLFANLNDPTEGRFLPPVSALVPALAFAAPPFARRFPYSGTLATMYAPMIDKPKLIITFPVPDQRLLYDSNPCAYYGYLLEIDEPTSLLGRLLDTGLIKSLHCSYEHKTDGLDVFKIEMVLTDKGDLLHNRLAGFLFVYLEDLLHQEPQQMLFEAMVGDMKREFEERNMSVFDEAVAAVQVMQLPIPRERLLSFHIPRSFDAEIIKSVGQYLQFSNCLITHMSARNTRWTKRESLFGVRYSTQQLQFKRQGSAGLIVPVYSQDF